jgi:hypothetical protein
VPITKQPGATFRYGASRRWRQLGVTFVALICGIGLAGCGPAVTLNVVGSGVAFEGGSCFLDVDASGLANDPTIGIGMFTTGSSVLLGVLTANNAGVITDGRVTYPSDTRPQTFSNVNVGLYDVTRGSGGWKLQTGDPIISVKVNIPVCLPSGLAR